MRLFANADINWLAAHSTLHRLAWGGSGVFFGIFLLRQGLSPAAIFLAFSAIYAMRFLVRPLVGLIAPTIGLRQALILGTLLQGAQYPLLAFVHGADLTLLPFCVASGVGAAFYFTCYHAMFAAVGDVERRGSQVGGRQVLSAAAAVAGPAAGGIMLATAGPWVAFGTAAAIEAAAIVPLFAIGDPPIERVPPEGSYAAARTGVLLFATDGWINGGSVLAWTIIMFRSLDTRFDAFGGTIAAAALAGALGGMVLGRLIDLGHARRATVISAAVLIGNLIVKSVCGTDVYVVVAVTIGTTLLGGLYIPTLLTAFYNEAKGGPCPLRFQIAAEAGWDIGATVGSLLAAAVCAAGAPLQAAIAIAVPAVVVQALLLRQSYAKIPSRRAATLRNYRSI
jgi:MFS transporter, DHA1 family, inner membrane transport protein